MENKIACECRNITYSKIEEAVKNGFVTFEQVSKETGAGKSCGECRQFIACLVERFSDELQKSADQE